MISLMLILLAIGLSVYWFYKWYMEYYSLFAKQGLKIEKPLPLIGNSFWIFTGDAVQQINRSYWMFPKEKVVGFFQFLQPGYLLRSPELIKRFTIKDFSYFQDHLAFVNPTIDDIFGNILFSMKDKQWRDMRSTLSPLFTGNKMRLMLDLIIKCSEQMCKYLQDEHDKNGPIAYRVKNLFSKYTNDAIATCAFGVEVNSLKYPNNEIYKICQIMLGGQTPTQAIKFILMRAFPKIAELLGVKIIPDEVKLKFKELITHTMEVRKRENIQRPDLLQLLMRLKEGQLPTKKEMDEIDAENKLISGEFKRNWTDDELMAQCFLFFLAGFDTTSTVLSFCCYELAANPDLQEKLIQEIDEVHEHLNGTPLTYEVMTKMKYMDMFISEVLRMWPPVIGSDRECRETYTYEGEDGLKFTVQKGNIIFVPIYELHMDPNYFPNPKKFDPERFSDNNRRNINLNTYLPFGVGPRNCIGFRFALMQMKTVIYYVLLNFRFTASKETEIPLKIKKSIFGLIPAKEIQLQIIPRKEKEMSFDNP